MKVVPFDYMVQDGVAHCPKCSSVIGENDSSPDGVSKTTCPGTMTGKLFGKCPPGDHFHRKCPYCDGHWVEATYENSRDGARVALHAAFECIEHIGFSEDDVVKEWRDRIVRGVMTG
jgi:hypothetical protein